MIASSHRRTCWGSLILDQESGSNVHPICSLLRAETSELDASPTVIPTWSQVSSSHQLGFPTRDMAPSVLGCSYSFALVGSLIEPSTPSQVVLVQKMAAASHSSMTPPAIEQDVMRLSSLTFRSPMYFTSISSPSSASFIALHLAVFKRSSFFLESRDQACRAG